MEKLLNKISVVTRKCCVDDGYDMVQVDDLALSYVDMYRERGYVDLTCREALEQPDIYGFASLLSSTNLRAPVAVPLRP